MAWIVSLTSKIPPKSISFPLKIDGWKMKKSPFEIVPFLGTFVHLRGGIFILEGTCFTTNRRATKQPVMRTLSDPE